MVTTTDPHRHQPVLHEGPALADARLVAILIHGRGASAEDILGLAREFRTPGITYLAPQAAGHTWYPFSFLSPLAQNEPGLTSALGVIGRLVAEVQAQGVPPERIVLMGFSQGACLTLEYAARQAAPYAVVAAFSGGLIGPPGTPRDYPGTLTGARVFLGCSDVDAHIPVARVRESAEVFRRLGASVDERIYPQMGHTVNRDELSAVDAWLTAAAGAEV
ncbi:MAG: alpha/beta fold hydrolase [Acidobacteria bacterium]|nr:alpha/beta fold hydrolase [Acidobacteriota bacterium]